MRLEHYYVNLVDLPEVLPFTVPGDGMDASEHEKIDEALFRFMDSLEEFDTIHYIGQDNIEGKFYQRFLFREGGFIEVMMKAPSAVIAHFAKEERAQKFAQALQEAVVEHATEERAASLLSNDIAVSREEEGSLSYEKWSKLKNIRDIVG